MRAMQELGCQIGLLTSSRPQRDAIRGLSLCFEGTFLDSKSSSTLSELPTLQRKFTSYWGIDPARPGQVAEIVKKERFDVVVVVGLNVLPYLALVENAKRVWYAADEWFLHHWSLIHWSTPSSWKELKPAMIKGLYERVFAPCVDRVWAVSRIDARFFNVVMGARNVDIVPNGVDFEQFSPQKEKAVNESCVFWGRLDFKPNLDAIQWFGEKVFTPIRATRPNASWTVFGFAAGESVKQLQNRFGFELVCDLPDLRTEISRREVVVLPFISGAGLKNKFLEAAALGMPILASKKATNGLNVDHTKFRVVEHPNHWIKGLVELWDNDEERDRLGSNARTWVVANHDWRSSAKAALKGMIHPE
jgi:glycosyltransferase involved in cell wall biosynthesis